MRKRMRETLVGIFIILGIILIVVMYVWLSGRISLRNTYAVTVHFSDVLGLRVGDPVQVYGLEKGKVKSLDLKEGKIEVILALDREILLPKDSEVAIRSVSYVASDRYIKIIPGKESELSTVFQGKSDAFDLEEIAARLDTLFGGLEEFNISSISDIAQDLSDDIDKNMGRLVAMMKEPTNKLSSTIKKTEQVIGKTEQVIEGLDSLTSLMRGEGTVGKLMRSDSLYQELRESNQALKDLLQDIKENPARYLKNIKIL